MSDYIKAAFARMNLQQTVNYLLFGVDRISVEIRPYKEVLKESSDPIYRRLETIYPDGIELDKAAADLDLALLTYEQVYMEIGMKAGARLVHQLLLSND